jgi:hypothetical protein
MSVVTEYKSAQLEYATSLPADVERTSGMALVLIRQSGVRGPDKAVALTLLAETLRPSHRR